MINITYLITFNCDNGLGGFLNYGLIVSFASTILLSFSYIASILKKASLLKRTEGFETYEFGTTTIGNSSFVAINKHYYILGILFIIFDVELMYIFPWIVTLNNFCFNEKFILINFLIFIMLGYSCEIASGAINWYSTPYYGHSLKWLNCLNKSNNIKNWLKKKYNNIKNWLKKGWKDSNNNENPKRIIILPIITMLIAFLFGLCKAFLKKKGGGDNKPSNSSKDNKSNDIKNWLKKKYNNIKNWLKKKYNNIKNWLKEGWKDSNNKIKNYWENLPPRDKFYILLLFLIFMVLVLESLFTGFIYIQSTYPEFSIIELIDSVAKLFIIKMLIKLFIYILYKFKTFCKFVLKFFSTLVIISKSLVKNKIIFLFYLNINIIIMCNIYIIVTNWDNFLCTIKYQRTALGLKQSLMQVTIDHQLFNSWFGLDFFSLILILITSFITILAILSNWNSDFMHSTYLYLLLVFWIEFILFIAFSSLDLFIFFLSFEGITIPTFFIVYLYGLELTKIRASFMFLICSLSSSTFLALALITLHSHYKTSNIGNLCIKFYYTVPLNENNMYKFSLLLDVSNFYLSVERFLFLWIVLFISFAIKLPLCPFHMWLPEAHSEAPTGGSIILAGAILKLGGFALFRFFLPLMSSFTFYLPAVYTIILTGIYYTSIVCIRINHMKQIIAYSSVSHMGASTLALMSNYNTCVLGSLYSFIQHSLVTSGFFILINIVYERSEVYEISMYGGLNQTMPYYSMACLFQTIINLPFPFSGSFIGEFFIISSIWRSNFIALFIFSLSHFISAIYNIWYTHRIIFTGVNINFSLKKKIVKYVDLRYIELILIFMVNNFAIVTGICSNLFLSTELI